MLAEYSETPTRSGLQPRQLRQTSSPPRSSNDEKPEFFTKAACKGLTDLFFGPYLDLRNEPEQETRDREEACREVCETCSIQWECFEWSIITNEPYGFWGGMNKPERRQFGRWMKRNDYKEVPTGKVLEKAFQNFRKEEEKRKKKFKRVTVSISRSRPVYTRNRSGRSQKAASARTPSPKNRTGARRTNKRTEK